ncbi:MAG: zinc-dependent metalloprotease, partial [Bacteroidota bacterium]
LGPPLVLVEQNLDYRAVSNNFDEQQSVADAFARSVLAGFKVEAATDQQVLIDLTPMLLTDAHGVTQRLKARKQGIYKVDAKRSVVYLERTKNFPKNSEFEAMITFSGEPSESSKVPSVAPTAESFSLRMHHSFVELPDDEYKPRIFDPRCGYFPLSYADYATPIEQPLIKKFIRRHRLTKKDPSATISEAVEPIVYYLDRGAPEPIRSALIEGGNWWNQAFEAAGYKDAFRVELLPEGADPLDVRYNVINWVHRSTRGWSYGSSVTDPRTGEIIKGHVLLGSLRVRQDFLIAQGLIAAYENGTTPDPRLKEMALARLRQLSAHEIGHTLGLAHNFSASIDGRASVMDYPHPFITLNEAGEVDLSDAYDIGIGNWDKRTILYGYQDFPAGTNEQQALREILADNTKQGFHYISDADARPVGGAQPEAHLWDNGADAVAELERLSKLRKKALNNFGRNNLPIGDPLAKLENVFVPLYLMHRYQVEAVAKIPGGYQYGYAINSPDKAVAISPVKPADQERALRALLKTLSPTFLSISPRILALMPPQPIGYGRDRELFTFYTGPTFDPLAAAEASAEHTLRYLLHPARLARIHTQSAVYGAEWMSLSDYLNFIEAELMAPLRNDRASEYGTAIAEVVHHRYYQHLLQLAASKNISPAVQAVVNVRLGSYTNQTLRSAHFLLLTRLLEQFRQDPNTFKPALAPKLPDGSPIGCGGH